MADHRFPPGIEWTRRPYVRAAVHRPKGPRFSSVVTILRSSRILQLGEGDRRLVRGGAPAGRQMFGGTTALPAQGPATSSAASAERPVDDGETDRTRRSLLARLPLASLGLIVPAMQFRATDRATCDRSSNPYHPCPGRATRLLLPRDRELPGTRASQPAGVGSRGLGPRSVPTVLTSAKSDRLLSRCGQTFGMRSRCRDESVETRDDRWAQ